MRFLMDFKENVQGERPMASTVNKYIKQGTEYLSTFNVFPYNKVGVEDEIQFDIGGVPFIGYIDYLGEKDGEYYIVDNKSRDMKPRSKRAKPTIKDMELDKMLRQLYIYSAGVKSKYGKFPKALCFNCFRTGVFISEVFNEQKYHESIEWALKTIEEIKGTNIFNPNVDFFTCKYICGLNEDCCYWQGR